MTAALAFLAGLVLCVAIEAVAVAALSRLRRRAGFPPAPAASHPFVSIVKPLCGLDAELEGNLESFFRLDYPSYEVVFSFASREDPALPVARLVADRHPEVPAVFVVDPREPGWNAKVNRLAFGLARARGSVFLLADGDVRVPADFLTKAVSLLSDPSVGLVSHLFRAIEGPTAASRIEAAYLDGVLRPATAGVALLLRRPCVVGKALLLRRAALQAIGGMAVLRNHLAEDFLLGDLMKSAGYRVVLSPHEVETRLGARSARSVWARHRRWAILRRRLGGAAYASEALSSPAPFAAGAIAFSAGDPAVVAAALVLWAIRAGLEARALARPGEPWRAATLGGVLMKDVASVPLFWAGLAGRRTRWRGRLLEVGPRTLLEPARRSARPRPRSRALWEGYQPG